MVLKKRLLALALVGVMVLGSSITAFAEDGTTGTLAGNGDSTGHLDTNVVTAILPTADATVFDFTVDPENILSKALKLKDGTAVTANDDLVYFKNTTPAGYSASSDKVSIKAKNYVAADLSVTAAVTKPADADEDATIIPLAADGDDDTAGTLALQLKVGTKSGYITEEGVTVTDTVAAQAANFDTVYEGGKYIVKAKSGDINWSGLDVQLIGKVNAGTVDDTIVAPKVTLTWTMAAHVDGAAPSIANTAINYDRTADLEIPVSLGTAPLAATDITSVGWDTASNGTFANSFAKGTKWTFENGKLVLKGSFGTAAIGDKRYLKVTFNDTANTSVVLTLTIAK